jgi:hypothetical protein
MYSVFFFVILLCTVLYSCIHTIIPQDGVSACTHFCLSGLIFPFATVLSLSYYICVRQKDMDLRKADWQGQILGKLKDH